MKKLVTATIIALSAGAAQAAPFDFERQFGTPELYPTLTTEGIQARSQGGVSSPIFAHERSFGAVALYPTLVSEQIETNINVGASDLKSSNHWVSVWNTDVEIGG